MEQDILKRETAQKVARGVASSTKGFLGVLDKLKPKGELAGPDTLIRNGTMARKLGVQTGFDREIGNPTNGGKMRVRDLYFAAPKDNATPRDNASQVPAEAIAVSQALDNGSAVRDLPSDLPDLSRNEIAAGLDYLKQRGVDLSLYE